MLSSMQGFLYMQTCSKSGPKGENTIDFVLYHVNINNATPNQCYFSSIHLLLNLLLLILLFIYLSFY